MMALRNVSSDDSRYSFSSDSLSSIRANKEKYNDYVSQKKSRTDDISVKSDNLQKLKQLAQKSALRSKSINRFRSQSAQRKVPKSYNSDYVSQKKNSSDDISVKSDNLQKLKQLAQKNALRKNINSFGSQSAQRKGPKSCNSGSIKNPVKVSVEKLQLPERPLPRIGSFSKVKELAQKNSLKKSINNFDSQSAQRSSPKPYNSNGIKNPMKVPAQKLQLPERPLPRIGSSSKQTTFSASEIHSVKNRQLQSKKNEESFENYPLSKVIGASKDGCKREATGVIHIEVFMPVIDSERNRIIYPKSRKPIIKYYPVKEYHLLKSKSPNNINNKNGQTNLKKSLLEKKKKDSRALSNRKTVSSPRIGKERNNCKNSLVKREPPLDRDLSSAKIKDLPKIKGRNETPKFSEDMHSTKFHHSVTENTEHKDKINSGVLEFVFNENNGRTNNDRPNSNLDYEIRENVNQNAMVSESVLSCAESETGTFWNNVEDGFSQISICDEEDSTNEEENTRSLSHSPREPNQKKVINYKQSHLKKIDNENAVPASLPPQPLVKSKSDGNGWRRNIPTKADTNRCSSSISRWRTDVKGQDELSMETWLDRCKYLQSRKQNLQNDSCEQNSWRKV